MSRNLSLRDVKRIPGWEDIPELAIVQPEMDAKMAGVFLAFGFDLSRPITYHAAKHRDLSGHIALGIYAIGELNKNAFWYINHPICSDIERMMCSKCMVSMAELRRILRGMLNPRITTSSAPYFPSDYEPDHLQVAEEIRKLEEAIHQARHDSRVYETMGLMSFNDYLFFKKK